MLYKRSCIKYFFGYSHNMFYRSLTMHLLHIYIKTLCWHAFKVKIKCKTWSCYFRKPTFLSSLAHFFPNPELRGFKSHTIFRPYWYSEKPLKKYSNDENWTYGFVYKWKFAVLKKKVKVDLMVNCFYYTTSYICLQNKFCTF